MAQEVKSSNTPLNIIQSTKLTSQSLTGCTPAIRKLYDTSKSDVIQDHQRAHLIPDPELDDISDTGLPEGRDLEVHAQNSDMATSELLVKLRKLKLRNKILLCKDNLITITWVRNPWLFYVRRSNFIRQLDALEKDLNEYAEQAKILHSASTFDWADGRICIGRQLEESSQNQLCADNIQTEPGKDAFEYKRVQILRLATTGKILKYLYI